MVNLKRPDGPPPLIGYWEVVRHCMDSGSAPGFKGIREALFAEGLTQSQRTLLDELDAEALEYVTELDFVESDLLYDDPAQPLVKWWWHLGAIRHGTYPLDVLPAPLREAASSP